MSTKTNAPYVPHISNQVPSVMGVEGTLGTADTSGTARVLPVGVNPATGAMYVQDLSGAAGTTNVQIVGGTFNAGTVTTTLALNTGTITTIVAGTQNTLGTVGVLNNGTLAQVTSVSNLASGTLAALTLGTVTGKDANAAAQTANPVGIGGTDTGGTIRTIRVDASGHLRTDIITGTVTEVTRVGNVGTLELGSVVVNSLPQVSVGTIPQVSVGTLPNVNVASGTQQTLGTVGVLNNGTLAQVTAVNSVLEVVKGTTTLVSTVTTVSNLTNGSVIVQSGTLGSVGAVAQVHNAGTVQGGTVQINPVPVPTILQHGTLGTAGGSFFGTLSGASGAGTKHYISNIDIVMESGTADVRVLAGTAIQGTGVLAAGKFPAGGGIAKQFTPAFATGTNSELIYHFVGAGTAFITVSYWKGA